MVKIAQSTIKYLIEAELFCEGIVEKPDVIGAVFGQTEGLLGSDLDLRELQRSGRIGRIEVELTSEEGKTRGKIVIPSSLDITETSLIAASLETIERIGPCDSKVKISLLKDVREEKRNWVVKRAKTILQDLLQEMPATSAITEKLKEEVKVSQLQEYKGLPCGPEILNSDEVIVVEGRADVLNLLKNGINNVIAMNGTKISQDLIDLTKEKIVTLFVDGDRAGELIIKEFSQIADVDYVALAPYGKEVEELSKKEIIKALRERVSAQEYKPGPQVKELKEFI